MKKSNHITRDGWEKLERELRFLWKEERPKVTQAVSEAAALGDRSENAEYIYGKKRLREIDRRVRFLSKRLDELQVVYPNAQQTGKVYFGAWLTLEDDNEQVFHYRIVGSDEFSDKKEYISIDSPMARALIGKQIEDEVVVKTPTGDKIYYILTISYTPIK